MTVRVVSLHSREAGDSRMEGTIAERLAMTRQLTERIWKLSGKPLPSYTRATMPVRIIRRSVAGGGADV